MKRLVVAFLFLMMLGGVLAMDGPITVRTEPGNWVKIYAWLPNGETQSIINKHEGFADEKGEFSYTFFSLNEETVRFQVRVLSGLTILRDNTFDDLGINYALIFDCTFEDCIASIDNTFVPGEKKKVDKTAEETTETTEEEVVTEEEGSVEEEKEVPLEEETSAATEEKNSEKELGITGKAIFKNSDGSMRWYFWAGSGLIVLFLGFILMKIFSSGAKIDIATPASSRELRRIQKQIQVKEAEINSLREGRKRNEELKKAKERLASEERELRELRGDSGQDEEIERAKAKLAEEEKELNSLKSEE